MSFTGLDKKAARPESGEAEGITAGRRRALSALACLALPIAPALADPLFTFPLRIRKHTIRVEVADTDASRRTGLMGRRHLGDDQGMVFVYPRPSVQSMWMKNTFVPLSVAFVGADGRILNIEDMQPRTEDPHTSDGPAAWSIEAPLGWFAKRGIRAGDRVEGLDALPKPR